MYNQRTCGTIYVSPVHAASVSVNSFSFLSFVVDLEVLVFLVFSFFPDFFEQKNLLVILHLDFLYPHHVGCRSVNLFLSPASINISDDGWIRY